MASTTANNSPAVLASRFGDDGPSSPGSSRPASRAQSDVSWATEITDVPGPRSLTREIEHIKHLIARSSRRLSRQTEGAITAQVFRNRINSAHDRVPHDHIFHELDSLKRRIRYEQSQWKKSNEVDPDTESEAEGEDVPDEREEEIESLREELVVIKQQREEWLEAAENKIDILINEKEQISKTLSSIREELMQMTVEKKAMAKKLDEAEQDVQNLTAKIAALREELDNAWTEVKDLRIAHENSQVALDEEIRRKADVVNQLASLQKSMDDIKTQLENVKAERDQAQAASHDLREESQKLRKAQKEAEAALARSSERIAVLEKTNERAAEQLRDAIHEHNAANQTAFERYRTLQESHDRTTIDAKRLRDRVDELTGQLIEAKIVATKTKDEHDKQYKRLLAEIEEHKKRFEEAVQNVDMHTDKAKRLSEDLASNQSQLVKLKQEHDTNKANLESQLAEKSEALHVAVEERQRVEQRYRHQLNQYEIECGRLQKTLEDTNTAHGVEIDKINVDHGRRIKSLEDELVLEKKRNEDTERYLRDNNARELESLRLDYESQIEFVQNQLHGMRQAEIGQTAAHEQLQQALKNMEETHVSELDSLRGEHADRMKGLQEELEASQKREADAHEEAQAKYADFAARLSTEVKENRILRQQLQLAEESHSARLNDMEGMLAEMKQKLNIAETHASESVNALKLKEVEFEEELAVKSKELVELHARLSEMEKSLKAKKSEFTGKIKDKNIALEEVRKQLSTLESKYNKKIAEVELERAKLASELELCRSQMDESNEKHDVIVRQLHEQHSRSHEDSQKRHAEEIEHLLSEMRDSSVRTSQAHAAEMEHFRAQMEDAARVAAQQHSSIIDEIQKTHAQALDTAKQDADARSRILVENHSDEVRRLIANHNAALDREREAAERLREELENKLRKESTERSLEDDEKHHAEIEKLQSEIRRREEEYENGIQRMKIEVQERIQSMMDEHQAETQRKNEEHQAILASLTAEHLAERKTAESDALTRLNEIEANHAHVLETLRNDKQRELEEAAQDHERVIEALKSTYKNDQMASAREHEKNLENLCFNHAMEMTELRNSLEAKYQQTKIDDQEQMEQKHRSICAQMERQLEDIRSHHDVEMARLQDEHQTSAAEAKEEFERLVSIISAQHLKKSDDLRNENAVLIASLKSDHAKALDGARAERQAVLEHAEAQEKAMKDAHTAKIDELKKNHQDQLQASLQKHDLLLQQQQEDHRHELEELQKRHNTVVSDLRSEHKRLIDEAEATWNQKFEEIVQSHKAEIQRVIEKSSEEASKAEEIHEHGLADRDVILKKLQTNLEQSRLSHKTELERVYKQQHDARIELEQQLEETQKKLAQNLSEQNSMRQEISSLKTRLDAELTGHAEAERAMAEMRRQKMEDASSRVELHSQITALQEELQRMREESCDSEEHTGGEYQGPSKVTEIVTNSSLSDDLAALKMQLSAAEQDRKQARDLFQQKLSETSELSRQNEFLVRELESLMAQLSTPKSPALNRADAEVQTEFPRSRKQSKSQGTRDPIDSVVESSNDTQSSSIYDHHKVQVEQKADIATLRATKGKPTNFSRPEEAARTLNGAFVANVDDGSGRGWKTRSFEDYLQTAQQELSELGSVISKNEALFAQKIQEHVSELQRAKDQLAAEYKKEFDALIAQRKNLDRDAQCKGAEDFAKERQCLVAQYGIESRDGPEAQAVMLTSLPLEQAKALRAAEQKLVAEHSRRVAKRRSQIALQHAEEFQSLTQDYDRRISELLSDKEELQSDLSVEPSKFEKELNDFHAKSKQLEENKAESIHSSPRSPRLIQKDSNMSQLAVQREKTMEKRTSQLPQRVITSSPRTPTSIPRVVQYPDISHSADSTSQSKSVRSPATISSSRPACEHAITQNSPVRSNSPQDGKLARRIFSTPSPSDKWRSPSSPNETTSQILKTEPKNFEQQASDKNMQPSLLSHAKKIARPRTKSGSLRHLRHSSGSILKLFPRQE